MPTTKSRLPHGWRLLNESQLLRLADDDHTSDTLVDLIYNELDARDAQRYHDRGFGYVNA